MDYASIKYVILMHTEIEEKTSSVDYREELQFSC